MQKEKESPWQPLQKTFSGAGLKVRKEDDFLFSFWCLGCSEPELHQRGCRMQVDLSLVGMWTYVHKDQIFSYLSLLPLCLSALSPLYLPPTLPS